MDAGKPQIGSLSGQPANIQLAVAVAEGHQRLAPPVLQGLGSEWSVTTEDILLHRERKVVSPRRATGSAWVIADGNSVLSALHLSDGRCGKTGLRLQG